MRHHRAKTPRGTETFTTLAPIVAPVINTLFVTIGPKPLGVLKPPLAVPPTSTKKIPWVTIGPKPLGVLKLSLLQQIDDNASGHYRAKTPRGG